MFKPLLVLLGLVLGSSTGYAQTVINVQDTFCSGIQPSSLNSPLTLNCSGDFSLNGGVLADNSGIFLSAAGALTLDNITISAPTIQFDAGTSISVGGNVSLAGSNISLASGAAGTIPLLLSTPPVGNLTIQAAPVINWPDFSIGVYESVTFLQLSASSAVLNRVTVSAPTALERGTVALNGQLSIPRFNGVLVVQSGMVGVMPVSAVPEPGSYATILTGLLCLAGFMRVRRRKV